MTPPKTKKLFISYRSSDAPKVDRIANDLKLLRHDDGTPRYTPWQDKHNLPPASPSWWDAIVDAIIACDLFVFHISRESLHSEVCRAELDYAYRRNRPIIALVLEGEFILNPQSGKYDLPKDVWPLLPDWLRNQQLLFQIGADFFVRFQAAVELYELNWPRDLDAPRPLNPDKNSVHGSNHALYDAACDYAERLAFTDAETHFRALVRRNDATYGTFAAQWIELMTAYAELIEIDRLSRTRFLFPGKWEAYAGRFPVPFIDGMFDPRGFATRSAPTITVQPPAPPAPRRKTALQLLPQPFAWIPISALCLTFEQKRYANIDGHGVIIPEFQIAKFPITNAQYNVFVETDGYGCRQWWTDAGWEARLNGWIWEGSEWVVTKQPWTEPRYWRDSNWNTGEQPVIGVSWYEAVAYCRWLRKVTGEAISLPSERQWERAAQGDDERQFPWGNKWDGARCNNSVRPCESNFTTPVQQYAGKEKGESPFGVVDMAGNVLEWCLTENYEGIDIETSRGGVRALRGGAWNDDSIDQFRSRHDSVTPPYYCSYNVGFRVALS